MDTTHLSDLGIFAVVARSENFSVAARELSVNASTISKAVTRLEARLGTQLVARGTRNVSLTQTGQEVASFCSRIVAEAEAVDRHVSTVVSEPHGVLRINAPLTFGLRHIASHLPDFARLHPKITIDVTFSDRYIDLIEHGYDLAIRIVRSDEDSALRGRFLARDRRVVCASPGYLRQFGVPQTPEDLRNHRCLLYSHDLRQPLRERWWFHRDGQRLPIEVAGCFRADTGEPLLHAALAGLGIVQMPCFLAGEDIKKKALQIVLSEFEEPDYRKLYAVYPHTHRPSPRLTTFINYMVERIGKQPYWEP